MNLSSIHEIDDFLVSVDKKKCPWCDGNNWAMRITPQTDPNSTDTITGIRSLPEFSMQNNGDNLKGEMSIGVKNAMPLIVVRCNECGHVYLFDYFLINEILQERKLTQSSNIDEDIHE